jgi:hypothetical protein
LKIIKVICVSIVVFSQMAVLSAAEPEQLTLTEILAKCEQTQQVLSRQITKSETLIESRDSEKNNTPIWYRENAEFRYDNGRYDILRNTWVGLRSADEPTPLSTAQNYRQIWDGNTVYDGMFFKDANFTNLKVKRIVVSTDGSDTDRNTTVGYYGAPLNGVLTGDMRPMTQILKDSENLLLRKTREWVGSSLCFVVEASGEDGRYKIWIDPEHGYNIAKAQVDKTGNDRAFGERMEHPSYIPEFRVTAHSFVLDNVRFEKVDDKWVPAEADFKTTTEYNGKQVITQKRHHKRTYVNLNPDFEAVGAFVPQIPNGTGVDIFETQGVKYKWQDGKAVLDLDELVIKALDNIADDEKRFFAANLTVMKDKTVTGSSGGNIFTEAAKENAAETEVKDSRGDASRYEPEKPLGGMSFSTKLAVLVGLLTLGIMIWKFFGKLKETMHEKV